MQAEPPAIGANPAGTLNRLLSDAADNDPSGIGFRDQPGRFAWSGRPSREWSRQNTVDAVRRLAAYLATLRLEPGSRVGLYLPNGVEACLAILAVEAAGLTPCFMDLTWGAGDVSAAIEAADVRALVTQTVFGEDRPASKLCFVAAGFFRLRSVMAFGPDVPAGVIDLDWILANAPLDADPLLEFDREPVSILYRRAAGRLVPVSRTHASLIAAAAVLLATSPVRTSDRIVSLLAPDDLKGLATGLLYALASGATFEPHGLFEGASLVAALDAAGPVHLVVPGWMEAPLAESGLGASPRTTVLVHAAPLGADRRAGIPGRIIDVVSFEEVAILPSARIGERIALETVGARPDEAGLLQTSVAEGGVLRFRGAAASGPPDQGEDGWIRSGFRLDLQGTTSAVVCDRTA